MYGNFIFEGGTYKHERIVELIEDLGGYITTRRLFAQEATLTFTAPIEDKDLIDQCAKEIQGSIKESPLLGTEIAVVSPTLTRHHLPHHLCDIAEYLRRQGAQTNMIGLARGVGRRTAQLNQREKRVIEEHDLAVICTGNFKRCIEEKMKVFSEISIPLVFTGLPHLENPDFTYIEKFGRLPYKFKRLGEIELLKKVGKGVEENIKKVREEISVNPPIAPPFVVKDEILNQVEDVKYGLSPDVVTLRANGLRVKIPFHVYVEDISNVGIAKYRLGDISTITRSANKNRILVDMLPESLVEV
ncbi:MAG: methyl-coenzyme M reductase family protein [Halobacteriota archaeon]|nr:methyl-coenzyme M reductase family protein [Halobacteriota archaeon]